MFKSIKQFFLWISSTKVRWIANIVLIVLMLIGNSYMQLFCQPTALTWCLIIPFLIATIAVPKLQTLNPFSSFALGSTLAFWIYCILFLDHFNLYALLTVPFLVGIVGLAPFLFSVQLIAKLVQKRSLKNFMGFAFAMVTCFGICLYSYSAYSSHSADIEKMNTNELHQIELNHWNERIVGMHLIYHTRVCEFDGWRPPLHDPFLVIGFRLNGFNDPLYKLSLQERIHLYECNFPDEKVHQKSACGCIESGAYHSFFNP